MRVHSLLILAMMLIAQAGHCQGSYLVKTATLSGDGKEKPKVEDSFTEDFIHKNFPRQHLANWKPGLKFMVIPSRKDLVISTFKDAETNKDIPSSDLKYKILTYQGHSLTEKNQYLHFNFYCEEDGRSMYHEEKNVSFADFAERPKAGINTLAYLGDVDLALNLLKGQTLYTTCGTFYVDDTNSQSGYREISVENGIPVTVVNAGVGTREYPVKLIVRDSKGKEFFQNVAISKTNCGMRDNEFIMNEARHYFPNSFSFTDPNGKRNKSFTQPYLGKKVHTKKDIEMTDATGSHKVRKYTTLTVKSLTAINNSNYMTGVFVNANGTELTTKVTFTNAVVIGDIDSYNELYFQDMFALGDLRSQHSKTSDYFWDKICDGKVEKGMTRTECKLAMGEPFRIYNDRKTGREDWIYENHTILCFVNGVLDHIN